MTTTGWSSEGPRPELTLQARVTEPTTGRVMEVWTQEPALQFYAGNFLDGTLTGKGGWVYQFRDGFLHGTAALSGLAQQADLSVGGAASRADV